MFYIAIPLSLPVRFSCLFDFSNSAFSISISGNWKSCSRGVPHKMALKTNRSFMTQKFPMNIHIFWEVYIVGGIHWISCLSLTLASWKYHNFCFREIQTSFKKIWRYLLWGDRYLHQEDIQISASGRYPDFCLKQIPRYLYWAAIQISAFARLLNICFVRIPKYILWSYTWIPAFSKYPDFCFWQILRYMLMVDINICLMRNHKYLH